MPPASLRLRSDEHLVSLFRAGREDAFDALHERHRRRMLAVAARAMRGQGGDPEGVVQEAFLRAHRALRADQRPIDVKPWLHRVVRNLCIDELRQLRRNGTTSPLEDGDRAGASEDVYSTLSRRHELRRLIEDLADLPEQQRAALLMRELDGLSHDEVASALEISPAASRQLVKRARSGLVAAAEARDADCAAIRDDLLTAHDERRRPSEHALRHLRGCAACSEFRAGLKATRGRLRALVPPIGMGPLAGVLHLLGGAAGGGGVMTKVVAAGCCALLAGGTATTLVVAGRSGKVAGSEHVERHRSPGTEAGGKSLIGKPLRTGTKLPRSAAISTVQVQLPAGLPRRQMRLLRVSCPPGMRGAGLSVPRTVDGKEERGLLRAYQYSYRDMDLLERDTGRRTVTIRYVVVRNLPQPVLVRMGTLCKRR